MKLEKKYLEIFENIDNIVLIGKQGKYNIFNKEKQIFHWLEYDYQLVISRLRELSVPIFLSEKEVIDEPINHPMLKWDDLKKKWVKFYPS